MAGGWTRDGAVQDQIDDTVKDAVAAARARTPTGPSAEFCDDCGAPMFPNPAGHSVHTETPVDSDDQPAAPLH